LLEGSLAIAMHQLADIDTGYVYRILQSTRTRFARGAQAISRRQYWRTS